MASVPKAHWYSGDDRIPDFDRETAESYAERIEAERKKKKRSGTYSANFSAIDFSREIPAPPRVRPGPPARSALPCPQVLSDQMEPVQSQVSGAWYDSKSAIRAEYKATGHIEKGNDKRPPWKMPRTPRAVIRDVVRKAAARVERGERNIHKGK